LLISGLFAHTYRPAHDPQQYWTRYPVKRNSMAVALENCPTRTPQTIHRDDTEGKCMNTQNSTALPVDDT